MSSSLTKLALVTTLGVVMVGCSKSKTGAPMQSPATVDSALAAAFDLASSDAFATVVVHPDRWSSLSDGVGPRRADLPEDVKQALSLASPYDLIEKVSGATLAGLDKTRPVVAGLYVSDGPELAPAKALLGPADGGFEGLRHRAILPASDAPALVRSIAAFMDKAELASVETDARLDATTLYAAFAEGDHVRVELVIGDAPAADRAAWRAHWKAKLTPAPTGTPSKTAARHFATSNAEFATLYVDLARLRRAHITIGTHTVSDALRVVDPPMKNELVAAGLAEVLSAWELLAPEDAFTPEIALSLGAISGGGLTLRVVASLSAAGRAAHEAARADAGPFLAPKDDPNALATVTVHTSYRALLEAAKVPPSIAKASKDDLAQIVIGCGWACSLGAGTPAVSKRLFELASATGDLGFVPRSIALSLTPAAPATERAPPVAMAIAGGYREGDFDDAKLMALLGKVPPGMFTTATDQVGDRKAVFLGMGVDPRTVISVGDAGPLMSVSVDLGTLANLSLRSRQARKLQTVLDGVGHLEGKLVLTGPALVGAFTIVPTGASRPTLELTDYSDAPAAAAPAPTDGSRCLGEAVTALARGWHELAQVAPEQRQLVKMKAALAAKVPLACAIGDTTVGEAGRLLAEIDALVPVTAPSAPAPTPDDTPKAFIPVPPAPEPPPTP